MAFPARHVLPALVLLVLGWVGLHAAEHEGWVHGVFHSHACEHACPDDGAPCADQAHHEACLCHAHGEALPCLDASSPAAKTAPVALSPSRAFAWVSPAVSFRTAAPLRAVPWLPPRGVGGSAARLLL